MSELHKRLSFGKQKPVFLKGQKKKLPAAFSAVGEELLNLIYPPRCPICTRILLPEEGRICGKCRSSLPRIRQPICACCGVPLADEQIEYCRICRKGEHLFRVGRSVFVYEKEFRQSVVRMKFENHREYLDFFAEEMAPFLLRPPFGKRNALLVPIPLHPSKRKIRGFDQAKLLAEKISRLSGLYVEPELLIRSRMTLPQKELSYMARKNNLINAIVCREKPSIPPETPIILIDDIYTTGATMDATAAALRARKFTDISFLALCTRGRV